MKKLKKISIDHYVIIDEAEEIKDNDFILLYVENYTRNKYETNLELNKQFTETNYANNRIVQVIRKFDTGVETTDGKYWLNVCKKITHSTKPLEENGEELVGDKWIPVYVFGDNVERLTLSEVEKLILGYSVEKLGHDRAVERRWNPNSMETRRVGNEIIEAVKFGFKEHQELTKDKVFTVEDMKKAIEMAREGWTCIGGSSTDTVDDGKADDCVDWDYTEQKIIQSILPKSEWLVEFDENGKLKLV